MQHTGLLYRVISLLGMVAVLAIAWGMDQFLEFQRKWAAASFQYPQFCGLSIVSRLVLMALWFGLGWLALFKSGHSRLIWITFLIVGLFWAFILYVLPMMPWLPGQMEIIVTLQGSAGILRSTGMFIAVLGLFNLALRSRSRLGA